ncbi:MAG: LamG domain-containing protein [Planctomycetaceae bacterium]|nr:LamG domain-containing protein [Planctomycetaceae bacterium]
MYYYTRTMRFCWAFVFYFSAGILAQGTYGGGDGSPENPFIVADFNDLTEMRDCPDDWGRHFILTSDIDLDPSLPGRKVYGRAIIASAIYRQPLLPVGTAFQGHFDGNGYAIQNLHVFGNAYNGFFGWVGSHARIRNLTIQGATVEGSRFLGAVAAFNQGVITHCQAIGISMRDIAPTSTGEGAAGGLVGFNSFGTIAFCGAEAITEGYNKVGGLAGLNTGAIYCCKTNGSVAGQDSIGGIVGYNGGAIENCFSDSSVVALNSAGGIAGTTTGSIVNCYTVSSVTGTTVGGVAGVESYDIGTEAAVSFIVHCYANGPLQLLPGGSAAYAGGVVGYKYPYPDCRVVRCLWNVDTTGISITAGSGVGLTDEQARDPQIFIDAGWDFAGETENGLCDDWYSPPGRQYPMLSFQHPQKATPIPFEGKGTIEKPYLIATAEEMLFISGKPWLMDKCFSLSCDIDLQDVILGQSPLAPRVSELDGYVHGVPFLGLFDGDGHSIRNLSIDNPECADLGLFGRIESGTLKDVRLQSARLYGKDRCGMLAGQTGKWVRLEGCSVQGWLGGENEIGGLVGNNLADIARCSFEGLVWGTYDRIGGLTGIHYGGAVMESCFNGSVVGRNHVGGLVGFVSSTPAYAIERCYAKGAVTGSQYVGGLVGSNGSASSQSTSSGQTIWNCYSHARLTAYVFAGGLAGQEAHSPNYIPFFPPNRLISPISQNYFCGQVFQQIGCAGLIGSTPNLLNYPYSSYFDKEIIGNACLQDAERYGRTTAQMKSASTYVSADRDAMSWDLETVWSLCEGTNYPRLRWQVPAGDWTCPDGIQFNDFADLAQCWMQAESPCSLVDTDQSGLVDAGELYMLAQNWLLGTQDKADLALVRFRFDENRGNIAYSNIDGLTGILCNMAESARQPGYFGNALQFDGIDDVVILEGFKGIPGGAARSCSVWLKTSVPGRRVLSWGLNEIAAKWVLRLDEQGRLCLDVGNGFKIAASCVADGEWHLITAVLNPGLTSESPYDPGWAPANSTDSLELFVDGQREEISSHAPAPIDTRPYNFAEIGTYSGTEKPFLYAGLMDELQIVPYALSPDEIRQMIPKELVTHWKLDERTGSAVYDSANHHDGVLVNMDESNWDASENALYFDGVDDYVVFPDFKGLTGGKTRSCCAWIKTAVPGGRIIAWGDQQPGARWVIRLHEDGRLRLEAGDRYRIGYRKIDDGKWHHIAVTMKYDQMWPGTAQRSITLYVDGMQEPLAEVLGGLIYTAAAEDVTLGVYAPVPKYFSGFMRDVRIYNYALPIEEIRGIINAPEGMLIAHWKLDEGQGTIAVDSADGHDGVLTNMDASSWDLNENALYFDGVDDYVEVPDFKGVSGSQLRTCSMWIKTQVAGKQILSWGTPAAVGAKWVVRLNEEGKVRAEVGDGYCIGSTPLADGQWHHIAVKIDRSDVLSNTENIVIYVDGLPETISERQMQYVQTSVGENVKIGVFSGGLLYFQGYIKDVRIYDGPLAAGELTDLYTSTKPF